MQDDETNTRAAAARNQNSSARPGTTGDEPTDEERVAELSRAARRVVHEPADPRADAFVASLGLAPDPEPTVTRPRDPPRASPRERGPLPPRPPTRIASSRRSPPRRRTRTRSFRRSQRRAR